MSTPSSGAMQEGAKAYFERKDISLIMESIMTGLVYEQPDDPLGYIEDCVKRLKEASRNPINQENNEKRKQRALRLATNAKIVDAPKGKVVLPALNGVGNSSVPVVGHPNIIFVLG
ncbi:hypothetical protein BDR26DRAFT_895051 [Obelidium mucronatum]|nr:hypothetical protein BDR26DRAFT_895051 [Obelidium mucronatum]